MTTRTISDMADDKIAKLFAGAANTQDRLNCELEKLQSASQTLRKFKNLKSPVSPSLTAPQPAPTSQSEFKPWIRSIPVPQALLFDGKTPNPFGMLYKDSPSGSSGSSSGLHLPLSNNPGTTIRSLASYPNALLDSKSERSSVIVAADQAANQSARNAQSSVFSQADSPFDSKPDKSSTIVAADQVANQLARIALSNSGDRESSTSTATTPWTPNVSTQGTSLPSFAEASVTHITHDTG